MGWWFGRKSAPADVRPFVPIWSSIGSCTDMAGEGFARSPEGMFAYVRSSANWAVYKGGAWELGVVRGGSLVLGGQQVVGPRAVPIASPSGGTTIDSQCRTAIGQILAALRQHGLIDT